MKNKILPVVLIVICAVLIFLGFYFVLQRNDSDAADEVEVSETQYLIQTNLESNYPATPRAVVNLYCRMLACLYNEEKTDEEQDALLEQMYLLLDDDLQEANPIDSFKQSMGMDLLSHANDGYKISDYIMPDTDEVTTKTIDGEDMSLLTVAFYIKDESGFTKSYQDFVLRQDDSNNWKIYGYSLHS